MLQQTRVDTVIPYYERFLKTFPTIDALASAKEQEVLKSWEGLGYYSRARNLLTAARDVTENYGGRLPKNSTELRKLKGFGPYTAAAVSSIAFNEPIACVDGNVKRVVSRLFATAKNLEKVAQELVEPKDPSSFNQAMMELGALICTPKNPKCLICPVRDECKARKKNVVDQFPVREKKKAPRKIYATAFVLESHRRILMAPRPAGGRFSGLWEVPTIESESPISSSDSMSFLKEQWGIRPKDLSKKGAFVHQLTHRTIHVTALLGTLSTIATTKPAARWIAWEKIDDFPLARLQQKVLKLTKASTKTCEH